MSDTLAQFAGQLLQVPENADRGRMLQNILRIVLVAWNLPVTQERNPVEGAKLLKAYQDLSRSMPPVAKQTFDSLIERRTSAFRHDPRLAEAEVAEMGGAFYIKATGVLPPGSPVVAK